MQKERTEPVRAMGMSRMQNIQYPVRLKEKSN